MSTEYYSGQGRLYIAKYNNGVLGPYRWLGNVPKLELTTEVETLEHQESYTGSRLTDKKIIRGKTVGYSYDLEEITTENLALAYQGLIEQVEAGTATSATSPIDIKLGDLWTFKNQGLTNVVIVDSTSGTAQPLVVDVDYKLNDKFGSVEIIGDLSSLTLPLIATYDHSPATKIKFLKAASGEYALRFEGLNTAEENAPVLVELHKASQEPAKQFGLINDEFATLSIEGEALAVDGDIVTITKI